jgi:hypothetical protein
MAFSSFKSVEEVMLQHQLVVRDQKFIQPIPFPVNELFAAEMDFTLSNIVVTASEAAVCEFVIAPVLKQLWMPYHEWLSLWSHVPLAVGAADSGVPDFFFCRRSRLGPVRDQPYLLVVEAKKDDFDAGWGQCAAAMLAAQAMNRLPQQTIYGCVSNGMFWQIGKLEGNVLTRDKRNYTISQLAELFAALNYVMDQAKQLVLASAA